ncbi:AAA family ATPase [Vibrio splendidus]|uniref:AAA family ATPase n=1 Tax=Vibrio splendidus TaxID=29497 RepID=UPI000C82DF8A|nr:AAA family ATPase [Vibrio splendidus]PMG51153.1 hypothetical protein BCU89_23535 [Vibrio splendidus]
MIFYGYMDGLIVGSRLVYCWVDSFRVLNDVDINLTNEYKFQYDKDVDLLTIESISYPSAFNKIKPVKVIVGQNGCGKSSYLSVIEHILLNGRNDFGFCVLENSSNKDGNITFDIYLCRSDINVRVNSNVHNVNVIHCSMPFSMGLKGMGAITVNSKHPEVVSNKNFTKSRFIDISSGSYESPIDIVGKANKWSSSKYYNNGYLSFVLLELDFYKIISSDYYEHIFIYIDQSIGTLNDAHKNAIRNKVILSPFIREFLIRNDFDAVEDFLLNFLDDGSSLKELDSNISESSFIGDFVYDYFVEDSFGLRLRFDAKNSLLIYDFMDELRDFFGGEEHIEKYFHLKLEGISSGERQMLNIENAIRGHLSKDLIWQINNLIIFIDEPDSHLHPEWQRIFLNELLSIVDDFLEIERVYLNVQIILTSHSPFLISDLISENVVFLDKGREIFKDKNSFASNIHSLLLDDFFMKKTIGEISSEMIDEVISFLSEGKIGEQISSLDDCEVVIEHVSNLVLRNELSKLYYKHKESDDFYFNKKKRLIELLENNDFEQFKDELRGNNV